MQTNPWILPEWIPALLQQAKTRPHLREVNAPDEATNSATSFEEEAFLSFPQLSWDTFGEPVFTCRYLPEAAFALTEPTYRIVVGGSIYAHLQRRDDGTYQAQYNKTALPLKALSAASIVTMDGGRIQSQTVQLWDQSEDVAVFSASGERFDDPWNKVMMTGKKYYLLLSSDLEIQPRPTYWHHLNEQTTLYLLEPGWSAQTQVLLTEKLLWQPRFSSSAPRPSSTLKSQEIHVHPEEPAQVLKFQEPFCLVIEHPELYELLYIRLAGQALDFEHYTKKKAITDSVVLQPQMFALKTLASIDLSLGFQQRETHVIERIPYRLELPVADAAILEQDGWRVLERDRPLNSAQTQWKPLRFYVQDIPSWSIFEGTTWIDTAWQRPKPLQACAGYGAPLKLQKSIYNNNAVEPALWIADQIINTGHVEKIVLHEEPTEGPRHLEVGLLHPIEPGSLHRIVWWDQEGMCCLLQPEQYEIGTEGASWFVSLPTDCTHPIAVGIAYDGEWLGSWFCDHWSDIYTTVSASKVLQIAILSRWFHLPLLNKDRFDDGKGFAYEHANEVLPIWLTQELLPQARAVAPGLRVTDGDEGWLTVVRSIYFDWRPTNEDIERLVKNISDPFDENLSPPEVARQLVGLLGRVNPILMASIIRAWIEQICLPQWGAPSCGGLIRSLYFGQAEETNDQRLRQRKQELLQELAVVMGIDSIFIKKSLLDTGLRFFQGQTMDVNTRRNIAIAMHVEPFRRLLSIYLLEQINKEIERKRSRK